MSKRHHTRTASERAPTQPRPAPRQPAPDRGYGDAEAGEAVRIVMRVEEALHKIATAVTVEQARSEAAAARTAISGLCPRIWRLASRRDRD